MVVRALVVPKQLKIGCCCYQQLTTVCHDPGNLGMALYCAPQRALFPDRPRRLDWQALTADRGHKSRASYRGYSRGITKRGASPCALLSMTLLRQACRPPSERARLRGV